MCSTNLALNASPFIRLAAECVLGRGLICIASGFLCDATRCWLTNASALCFPELGEVTKRPSASLPSLGFNLPGGCYCRHCMALVSIHSIERGVKATSCLTNLSSYLRSKSSGQLRHPAALTPSSMLCMLISAMHEVFIPAQQLGRRLQLPTDTLCVTCYRCLYKRKGYWCSLFSHLQLTCAIVHASWLPSRRRNGQSADCPL